MDIDEVEYRHSDEEDEVEEDLEVGHVQMEVEETVNGDAVSLEALMSQRRMQRQQSLEFDEDVASGQSAAAEHEVEDTQWPIVSRALEALRTEAAVVDLLPLLNTASAPLAEYIFRCPVPRRNDGERGVDEELRHRVLTWLLVLDYANSQAAVSLEQIPEDPMEMVQRVGHSAPHKICQHAFKKNDIVWICKNCQKDETCVLCNSCFQQSRHEGHEVYFYHTQAGGCCDCGDEDAWEPAGFCDRHGKEGPDPLVHLPVPFVSAGRRVLHAAVDFLLQVSDAVVKSHDFSAAATAPWGGPDARYYLVLHFGDLQDRKDMRIRDTLCQVLSITDQAAREHVEQADLTGESVIWDGNLDDVVAHAQRLRDRGLIVTLTTKRLHKMVKVALLHVQWLHQLAGVSGGICRLVVDQLGPDVLEKLMLAHGHLPRKLAVALHTLYLFLMADQSFKAQIAQSYATTYLRVSHVYAQGLGVAEYSLYTLSVQFLNRSTFVNDLVLHKDFLSVLCRALQDMVEVKSTTPRLADRALLTPDERVYGFIQTDALVYQHRRYSPVISDLKFVLNIPGIAARFAAGPCLDRWLSILSHMQYLHSQTRENRIHVEFETKDWMYAFNVQISLSHVLDCIMLWVRSADPREPLSATTPRVDIFAEWVMSRLDRWQSDLYPDPTRGHYLYVALSKAPLFPHGEMDLINLPSRRSFHIPLHRALAVLLRECCRNPNLAGDGLGGIQDILNRLSRDRRFALGLAEVPLSVLVLASEVRCGMWRRNGHVMLDQVVNYAEPPFCRIFRDMDVLLLQCTGMIMGAKELVNLVLHRLHVHGWLLRGEAVHDASEVIQLALGLLDRGSQTVLLAEEALQLLIILCTELPLPPLEHVQRIRKMLHREVVHRLASGPCTYSELQECCHQFIEASENVPEQLVESILADVAVRREAKDLEPEKFVLKEEAWVSYDPAFHHISVQSHQQATEFRPKPRAPAPLTPPPPPAHRVLAPLRLAILSTDAVIQIMRLVMRDAVEHSRQQGGSARSSGRERQFSDLLLFRSLHLLTLAVHVATERSPDDASPAEKDAAAKGKERLLELLRSPDDGLGGHVGGRKRCEAPRHDGSASVDADNTEGSVLGLAMALREVPGVKADPHMLQGLRWVLQTLERQDLKCAAAINASKARTANRIDPQDAEARKKQARESILSRFQKTAQTFLAEGEDDLEDDDETGSSGDGSGSLKIGPPECMACRGAREGATTLAYAAFCQRSSVLQRAAPPSTDPRRREGLVLQLCGHALHYECFDGFFATVMEQSEAQGHVIYDVTQREFPCLYCKAISNVLVPYVPEDPEACKAKLCWDGMGEDADGTPTERETEKEEAAVSMTFSPPRSEGPPASTADEEQGGASDGETEKEEVEPEKRALQEANWALLGDVTRVALKSGPLPKGLGPDSVLMVCEAVAYTIAVAQAEMGMGEDADAMKGGAPSGQDGLPALARLGWVIAALHHVEGYRGTNALSGDLERVLEGKTRVTRHDATEDGRNPCASHSGQLNLSLPLLTQNIWCLMVAVAVDAGVSGPPKRWTVKTLLQGLALARGLQVLWEAGALFAARGGVACQDVIDALEEEESYAVRAMARMGMELGASVRSAVGADGVEEVEPAAVADRVRGLREAFETADKAQQAFIRCAALLLSVLAQAGMLPEAAVPPTHAPTDEIMAFLEVSHITEAMSNPRWQRLATLWVQEMVESGQSKTAGRSLDYPVWNKARFTDLHQSYTELHSDVTQRVAEGITNLARPPPEHPAVCLMCNAALAAGNSECTRHAETCGLGTGVFFLLQECSVLLVYGSRASYFPSPYVDNWGERHKQFRGRPLSLNDKRIEALRKIWANQRVAYEVIRSRANAKHVIQNRFY